MANVEDSEHSVSPFQVPVWLNGMVLERLELNLGWSGGVMFPGIWRFCNKGKIPSFECC